MTYDKMSSKSDGYREFGGQHGPNWGSRNPFGWAHQPGFHPLKVVAVVASFVLFKPLGVLALGYFIWNSQRHAWAGGAPWMANRAGRCGKRGPFTGNQAFDEYQMEQIKKLNEERYAFHEYRAEQQRDKDAYEAFRSAQSSKPPAGEDAAKG